MSDVDSNLSVFDLHPSLQGVLLRPGSGLKLSQFGFRLLPQIATRDSQNGASKEGGESHLLRDAGVG